MDFSQFCDALAKLPNLSSEQKSLGILLWHEDFAEDKALSVTQIAKLLKANRLGNPNATFLKKVLSGSKFTIKASNGYRLRADSIEKVRELVNKAYHAPASRLSSGLQYLPESICDKTRGYIEKVALQLNGCYYHSYFDAAAVMLRRLIETLIIEAFKHLGRESEIQGAGGHYFMLGDLIDKSIAPPGIGLGREAIAALKEIKKKGDRAAHNPLVNAVRQDLDQLRDGCRVSVEELINIAHLKQS